VPGAHEARERALAPLQTQLLAYTSHAAEVKEWFYWPGEAGAGERAGPLSKDEIKHHFHRGRARARPAGSAGDYVLCTWSVRLRRSGMRLSSSPLR